MYVGIRPGNKRRVLPQKCVGTCSIVHCTVDMFRMCSVKQEIVRHISPAQVNYTGLLSYTGKLYLPADAQFEEEYF